MYHKPNLIARYVRSEKTDQWYFSSPCLVCMNFFLHSMTISPKLGLDWLSLEFAIHFGCSCAGKIVWLSIILVTRSSFPKLLIWFLVIFWRVFCIFVGSPFLKYWTISLETYKGYLSCLQYIWMCNVAKTIALNFLIFCV